MLIDLTWNEIECIRSICIGNCGTEELRKRFDSITRSDFIESTCIVDTAKIEDLSRLQQMLSRYIKALENLTPSGSEFVLDPERCNKYVRNAREIDRKLIIKYKLEVDKLLEKT